MKELPSWLPNITSLDSFKGQWEKYLAQVYSFFVKDFKQSRIFYQSNLVVFDSHISDQKEEGFWHVCSEKDHQTGERNIDLRRCERIRWIRPIIENCADPLVSVWKNQRGKHTRVLLWLEDWDYLVVLEEKPKVFILVTAYITNLEHTRKKLRKEREGFL